MNEFHDIQTEILYMIQEKFNLIKEGIFIQNISPEKFNVSPIKFFSGKIPIETINLLKLLRI